MLIRRSDRVKSRTDANKFQLFPGIRNIIQLKLSAIVSVLAILSVFCTFLVLSNTRAAGLTNLAYHQIVGSSQGKTTTYRISQEPFTFASGPLRVNPANPRYLTDGSGKAILLVGSNYWNGMQDGGRTNPPPSFDFNAFVSFLVDHGLNYTKAHVWEQAWHQSDGQDWYIQPTIYKRTGPGIALDGDAKFDLDQFNAAYFDRLRERVIAYGQNGIYVGIDLFDRFSVHDGNTITDNWIGHPFNASNNINGIDGDPTEQGNGLDTETLIIPAITAYQEAYVVHLVDTLNDLDNVIWEVAMEPWGDYSRNGYGPKDWVDHFISYIRTYEEGKPKQHPILQGVFYPPGNGNNDYLFGSDADVISPNAGNGEYDHDSPSLDGTKVVLIDTDHILWTETDGADWAWRAFTRGAGGFAIMDGGYSDYDDQGGGASYNDAENFRYNLGWILGYAERMNLVAMTPRGDLCSTGYCLANPAPSGAEFLVYLPAGSTTRAILEKLGMSIQDHKRISSFYLLPDSSVTVDLSATPGSFSVEWFNPSTGEIIPSGTVIGSAKRDFTAPFTGRAVLYLYQYENVRNFYLPFTFRDLNHHLFTTPISSNLHP